MIRDSKNFIHCKTHAEGNRIYQRLALPHIEAILIACGIERSSNKAFQGGSDGYYWRQNDRDGVGFGMYSEENGFEQGLMAFEEYEVNESDFVPQGEATLTKSRRTRFTTTPAETRPLR